MNAVGMLSSYISQSVYTVAGPFHPFGGAVDIIVVRQQDGTFKSSPWYVKFGKFQGVLKNREKIVDIAVNDVPTDFHMYLDHTGEAYFLKEPESDGEETVFSPPSAPSSGDEIVEYNKRRVFSGQPTKSVPESPMIKQGFEMPDAQNTESTETTATTVNQGGLDGERPQQVGVGTNIGVYSTKPSEVCDEAVNSISASGSGTFVDVKLSVTMSEHVKDGSETAARGGAKPPRSILGLMFGSRPPRVPENLSSSVEIGKELEAGDLHRLTSIERAEIVADLLESRWGTGGNSGNGNSVSTLCSTYAGQVDLPESRCDTGGSSASGPVSASSSTHTSQVEVPLMEEASERNPVIENDLPLFEEERPTKDEMEESAFVVEPFTKHMEEIQSNLTEEHWFLSTTEEQDTMVLLFREMLDNGSVSNATGKIRNCSHLGVQVADSTEENTLAGITDSTNAEMIIMSYDGHVVSAPVLLDEQQSPRKKNDHGDARQRVDSSQLSVFLHQSISEPSQHEGGKSQVNICSESPKIVDGSSNVISVEAIADPRGQTFNPSVNETSRATDWDDLAGKQYDVSRHIKPFIVESVEPAMAAETPSSFVKESHFPSEFTRPIEVVEGGEKSVLEKQNVSRVSEPLVSEFTLEEYQVIEPVTGCISEDECSESTQHIVIYSAESNFEGGKNVRASETSVFEFSQKENGVLNSSEPQTSGILEDESSESTMMKHDASLSTNKPLTTIGSSDGGDIFEPHELAQEAYQVLDSTEHGTSGNVGEDESLESTTPKHNAYLPPNKQLSNSHSCNEGNISESHNLLVISGCVGHPHVAGELACSDCKLEIFESHELVRPVGVLAERIENLIDNSEDDSSRSVANDVSGAKEQLWQKDYSTSYPVAGEASSEPGKVEEVVKVLEGTPPVKELERFYSFREFDSNGADIEASSDIFRNCQRAEDSSIFAEKGDVKPCSGACDVRDELNTLSSSSCSKISETGDAFAESLEGGPSDGQPTGDRPVSSRSNPMFIPRISNQCTHSEELRVGRHVSGSLPTFLFETEKLQDKNVYSQSVGSIAPLLPDLNAKVSTVRITNYLSSSSTSTAGLTVEKSCITGEEFDAGSVKQAMLDTPENGKDNIHGEDWANNSNTGVEISLCRHLLIEGMGIEAAAKAFASEKVSYDEFKNSGSEILANEKLVVKIKERYFPWAVAAPLILGKIAFGMEVIPETKGAIAVEVTETAKVVKSGDNALVPSSGGWRLWPFTFRRSRTSGKDTLSPVPNKVVMAATEAALQSPFTEELLQKNGYYSRHRRPKQRTYVLTSQQLASLDLKEGPNKVTFTFSTRVLGKQQVDARIYLWKWNTRVVISDVDGTITKSDVLGQFMPLVGKDWSQSGVTRLFSGIKDNGYELLFLSARAIAQAYLTRQFLLNLKQDGETLPDGPVVISPDGLFPSLYREVIRRAPHEFKISCLEAIRELFPPDVNPFYAGFGNRDTDEISYLKVGIPKGKIFIINPKGEVVVNHRVDMRSYTSLHSLVDEMFPPVSTSAEEAYGEDLLMVQEDFNSWNYWKMPLPDIDVDLNEKSRSQSTKKGGDIRR